MIRKRDNKYRSHHPLRPTIHSGELYDRPGSFSISSSIPVIPETQYTHGVHHHPAYLTERTRSKSEPSVGITHNSINEECGINEKCEIPGIHFDFWNFTEEQLISRKPDDDWNPCDKNNPYDLIGQMNSCEISKIDQTLVAFEVGARRCEMQWSRELKDPLKWSYPDSDGASQLVIPLKDKLGPLAESTFIVGCQLKIKDVPNTDIADEVGKSCTTEGSTLNQRLMLLKSKVHKFEMDESGKITKRSSADLEEEKRRNSLLSAPSITTSSPLSQVMTNDDEDEPRRGRNSNSFRPTSKDGMNKLNTENSKSTSRLRGLLDRSTSHLRSKSRSGSSLREKIGIPRPQSSEGRSNSVCSNNTNGSIHTEPFPKFDCDTYNTVNEGKQSPYIISSSRSLPLERLIDALMTKEV